jgi:hypothetical protein
MRAGIVVTISALLAFLFGAGCSAYQGWTMPGEAMPENGYIGLGVGLSLIVGCGLIVLLFYSSLAWLRRSPRITATDAEQPQLALEGLQ